MNIWSITAGLMWSPFARSIIACSTWADDRLRCKQDMRGSATHQWILFPTQTDDDTPETNCPKTFWPPISRTLKIPPPEVEKPTSGTEFYHHANFHWSARDICLWAKNSIWHSLPPKGVLNHCNYWITTLFPIYLVYRVYSWHSSECWCLMLKTSGGRSLVVGCGVVGVTAAVVAISLLRRVSAIAKFDTLTSTVCTKNVTHMRL